MQTRRKHLHCESTMEKWKKEKTLTSSAPFFHWAISFLSHAHLQASVVVHCVIVECRDTTRGCLSVLAPFLLNKQS